MGAKKQFLQKKLASIILKQPRSTQRPEITTWSSHKPTGD